MAKIVGIDGLNDTEINFELQRGAKFVLYQYCISLLVVTFKRSSDIYFVRQGESRMVKGLPWIALSALLGWWGIPWGPIYTVQSLITDFRGGKDVTTELMANLQARKVSVANAGAAASGR
jgi:hypothetical protein